MRTYRSPYGGNGVYDLPRFVPSMSREPDDGYATHPSVETRLDHVEKALARIVRKLDL
jgi:hypothetical protein